MFVKHAKIMLNLSKVHVKVEKNFLKFYDTFVAKPVYVITFKSEQTASFAYGRIIHAVLLHWGAVDVTEHVIEELMAKIAAPSSICHSEEHG